MTPPQPTRSSAAESGAKIAILLGILQPMSPPPHPACTAGSAARRRPNGRSRPWRRAANAQAAPTRAKDANTSTHCDRAAGLAMSGGICTITPKAVSIAASSVTARRGPSDADE